MKCTEAFMEDYRPTLDIHDVIHLHIVFVVTNEKLSSAQ